MNDALRQDKRSEGTVLLELEHYKADNERLIKLLEKSGTQTDFADFAQANKGGPRYIAGPKTYGKAEYQGPEEDNWIPQEAMAIANRYKDLYPGGLSDTLVNKML